MRDGTFFDAGLFFMSFSVALGVIAFIIPAHGATSDAFQIRRTDAYVDLCDATDTRPGVAAWVKVNLPPHAMEPMDLAESCPRCAGRIGP